MKPTDTRRTLAVLPGDGIGAEVTLAALPVFKVFNIPINDRLGDIGWNFWKHQGEAIPKKTWDLIHQSDAVLLGAITSKPQKEAQEALDPQYRGLGLQYVSPIIQLRQHLDLFANVRPCFSIKESQTDFHFCIIRENTEGLYSGLDYAPGPKTLAPLLKSSAYWSSIPLEEIACTLRLQSKEGLQRIFRFAFDYAATHHYSRVTYADKPNVFRQSSAFSRILFEQIASDYPDIQADILNVDAVGLWIVKRPEQWGVIVTENMFGDILSDVGAGMMGGLGFAPSANVGFKKQYFEPVHGSGPLMKSNSANPSAMFLTIGMLLSHWGYLKQAQKILQAITQVLKKQQHLTPDLGGKASTQEMAQAILEHCAATPHTPRTTPLFTEKHRFQLSLLSTSELSDALDSCGIEAALPDIKPLTSGMKLIGAAYTIQYKPYEQKPEQFQQAGHYIDDVPAHCVLVIDNQGMKECTVWGAILTQAALQRNLAGTVVFGAIRDKSDIESTGYPVFSTAQFMRSGKNRVYKAAEQCSLNIHQVKIHPEDILVADDNGVIVIPRAMLDLIIEKAQNIQKTEAQIKSALLKGSSLKQARIDYGYDTPWNKLN